MKPVKVWGFPVRLVHWANFLAIIMLCITGTYIHWPFLAAPAHNVPAWTGGYGYMNLARLVHLIAGWVLAAGLVGRFIVGILGNKYERLDKFFPFLHPKGIKELIGVIKYYAFMAKTPPHNNGHNAMASTAYLGFFILMAFQVVSGLALWSQLDPAGTTYAMTGWIFDIASNGIIRLAHYFVMFLVFSFVIIHVYAMWICDIAEKNGASGSMFTGNKFD